VPNQQDVAGLAARLGSGPAIVKDYVKSRKHEWDEACFIPDLADLAHAPSRTFRRSRRSASSSPLGARIGAAVPTTAAPFSFPQQL